MPQTHKIDSHADRVTAAVGDIIKVSYSTSAISWVSLKNNTPKILKEVKEENDGNDSPGGFVEHVETFKIIDSGIGSIVVERESPTSPGKSTHNIEVNAYRERSLGGGSWTDDETDAVTNRAVSSIILSAHGPGGIVAPTFTKNYVIGLEHQSDPTARVSRLHDKKTERITCPKDKYDVLLRYAILESKSITKTKGDTPYKGLEIDIHAPGYSFSETSTTGCVHAPSSYRPSKKEQETYTRMVTTLEKEINSLFS